MDESEFEALYRQHWQFVYSYARRRTRDPDAAADVTADVFAVAWRRRDDVPAGAEARLWLTAVARHTVSNQRRADARRDSLLSRLIQYTDTCPDAFRSATVDDAAGLREALGRLPDRDRELLLLVGWDGLSPSDAARVIGVSPPLARVRLHRARTRLRALLADPSKRAAPQRHVHEAGHRPVPAEEPA